MKGLCLLWSLMTTIVLGLIFAGIGAFFLLGSHQEMDMPEVAIEPEVSAPCYWTSSFGPDNESEFAIGAALGERSLDVVAVEVNAYGEDYVCPQPDGSESREFSVIGISPVITLQVDEGDIEDSEALGGLIGETLTAMSTLQTPLIDQLTIIFQVDANTQLTWTAPYVEMLGYSSAGVEGSELYEEGEIVE